MELEDFVAETIRQVVRGVKKAQGQVRDDGGIVNPASVKELRQGTIKTTEIKFDIAVTATKGTKTKGGIGVFFGGVGLGAQGGSEQSSANMNRIGFSVPVQLPWLDGQKEDADRSLREPGKREGR